MTLAHESCRDRWRGLVFTWVIAGLLIAAHNAVVRDYVALLDAQGRRGGQVSTPLAQVIPARHADAQMWVRHELTGIEQGTWRVRHTTVDNAPMGREVHWSSGFPWMMRGAATLQEAFGRARSPAAALEAVLLWFNAPLFLLVIIGWSAWTASRAGLWAGVLIACAMLGHQGFREGFAPTYVDHHGVIDAALLGLVLGASFMGFGWWRPEGSGSKLLPESPGRARRAAVLSGVCGAVALWLSASSSIWVIVLVGVGGLVGALWHGRAAQATGARFDAGVWRWWGGTGAAVSAACYLIEYAPGPLGWRLEVNHPLYSLAWWGGAELITTVTAVRIAIAPTTLWPGFWRLLPAVVALMAPPFVIFLGGTATFMPADAFVGGLRHFVAESRSVPAMIREFGFGAVAYNVASALILLPAVWLLARRRDDSRLVVGALTVVTGVFVALAWQVVRWWMVASVLQIVLLLWLVLAATTGAQHRRRAVLVLGALLFILPAFYWIGRDWRANRGKVVAAVDLLQPLYRDLAAILRASQPEGAIVLLASPNVSAGVSYFGRFQSIGTLFWENAPGLRAAAEMFCATSDDEALRRLQARGVTHIVVYPPAPFVGEYFSLLHPGRPLAEAKQTFGFRLAENPFAGPRWLQPIPYRPPPELAVVAGGVRLYKLAPGQREDARLFQVAVAQVVAGDGDAAESSFVAALELVRSEARPSFCGFAGEAAYEHGAHALAVRMLRRGLKLRSDPEMASLAAWILATSVDPAVRDGTAALALLAPLAPRWSDDPITGSAMAAAYAELGRFDEAVRAAARALDGVRRAGADAPTQGVFAQRLERYRARQPWRQ